MQNNKEMFYGIILQLHKKGGSSTTIQAYQPTKEEIRLQGIAADYAEAVQPNALKLNKLAAGLLYDNLGDTQVDYNKLLSDAQSQISSAQQGVADLAQGKLPEEYQKNMEESIASGVENTMGTMLDSLSSRGVLSSSVTNNATNDISKNISNTMSQQYLNNISTLNGLYGQQASLAGQNITTSAAAQEAAQAPALNLWNASLGLNGASLGALQAVGGKGSTTTTTSGGGSGLFGGILTGLAGNSGLFNCCTEDTKIKTKDGYKLIRHLKKGDAVIGVKDGTDCESTVIETLEPHYSDVYTVICESDKGEKSYISSTISHELMKENGEFAPVQILRIGDSIKNKGVIKGIAYSGERKVYDLKLDNANAYYTNGFVSRSSAETWSKEA